MEPKGTTRILVLLTTPVFMSAPILILLPNIFCYNFGRSQYISIKFPLHEQSERCAPACDFMVCILFRVKDFSLRKTYASRGQEFKITFF